MAKTFRKGDWVAWIDYPSLDIATGWLENPHGRGTQAVKRPDGRISYVNRGFLYHVTPETVNFLKADVVYKKHLQQMGLEQQVEHQRIYKKWKPTLEADTRNMRDAAGQIPEKER